MVKQSTYGNTILAEMDSNKNILLNLKELMKEDVHSSRNAPAGTAPTTTGPYQYDVGEITRPTYGIGGKIQHLAKIYLNKKLTKPSRPTLATGQYGYGPNAAYTETHPDYPLLKMKQTIDFTFPPRATGQTIPTPTTQPRILTAKKVVDLINTQLGLSGNKKFVYDDIEECLRFGNDYLYACTKGADCGVSSDWKPLNLESSAESFFTLTNILIMAGILVVIVIIIMLLKKKRQSYYYGGGYDFDDYSENYTSNRMGVPRAPRFNYY